MKRRRLPPKPEPVEGKVFIMGNFYPIEELEREAQSAMLFDDSKPDWCDDPDYNLRSSRYGRKRRT